MKNTHRNILLLLFCFVLTTRVGAQVNNCDSTVPNFYVNLAGHPDSTWISPLIYRNGLCCGDNGTRCLRFVITLDSSALGVAFNIATGAIPSGSMYYKIDCGPEVAVGSPICLNGPGPHELTFCKPGNNENTYSIVSVPNPSINSVIVSENCSQSINVSGIDSTTLSINSIFPGTPGQYNSYLSCLTDCNSIMVNYQAGGPSYIDYKICGTATLANCATDSIFCDTIRAYFVDNLEVVASPDSIRFCESSGNTVLHGSFSGGSGPYLYFWTDGINGTGNIIGYDTVLTVSSSGNYSFVVRDSRFPGCDQQYDNVYVNKIPNPVITMIPISPQICVGTPIQTIVTGALTYSWSPSQGISETTNDTVFLSPTVQTIYTVTGTDAFGCTSTAQTTYTPLQLPTVDAGIDDTICIGSSTQLHASAGTTYLWTPSTGLNNSNIQSPIASPTVTTTYHLSVTQPSGQIIMNGDFNSGNTGFHTDYHYNSNLVPEGNYYITTDPSTTHPDFAPCGDHTTGTGNMMVVNGIGTPNTDILCQTVAVSPNTDYAFSTWIQSVNPASPAIIQFSVNGVLLGSPFTASGTTCVWQQFFAYWNSGNNVNAVICIVNQNTTAAGNDFAIDDVNFSPLCENTDSVTVTVSNIQLSTVSTPLFCYNDSVGIIDLTVNGGIDPYTYSWSNGSFTEDLTNLHAGFYTVTVTDSYTCSKTTSVVISQPVAPLSASILSSVNVECFGNASGSADLGVTGGTTPYGYNWSNGADTEDIDNLISGTYLVTVTDANGCTATTSVVVSQPAAPLSASILSSVNVGCFGNASGSADLGVTGGTTPYGYNWSNGADTEDIDNLISGTYLVTVTDANGCTATTSVAISQPAAPLSAIVNTSMDVLCFGNSTGSVDLGVGGGTAPYGYNWSNGANTEDIGGLIVGTYLVTVTDANGCTATTSVVISQPAVPLSASISSSVNVGCFGNASGSADLGVAGGTAPYSYNWSNGANTEDIGGLIAGTYLVTVTDANGCTATTSVVISQPAAPLSASILSSVNVGCFGNASGSADLGVTGGTTPYSYNWSNGADMEDIDNLISGTYLVTVTDSNGCTATTSVSISQPPAPLSASILSSVNVGCFGNASGSADLGITGGTTPYGYNWSNGASTEDIGGLIAGTYLVTVTDANGCTATTSVAISQPAAPLSASILSSVNVGCFGNASGSADLGVTGGTTPYGYNWSNGADTEDIDNLISGTYLVTVTDANGCTATTSVVISQPAAPLSAIVSTSMDVLCFGNSTGSVDLGVSGGTASYSYNWSNGANTEDIGGLIAGTYLVTVTDANGCTATTSVVISQPSAPLSAIVSTSVDVLCFGNSTGSVDLGVGGGTAPYSYNWSNGANTEDISGLTAGTYLVTVTDANGCTATTSVVISQPAVPLSASISSSVNVGCFSNASGSADLGVVGGTVPYSYNWSNGANTEDISGLTAGTYLVTVTDANGCTATTSVAISQPAAPLSAIVNTSMDVLCFGNSTGSVDLGVGGGTAPYGYNWSNGSNTEDIGGLIVGTYLVTVTDANGCTATTSVAISQPAAPLSASILSSVNVGCFGNASGSADLGVTGGTTPYGYNWSNGADTEDIDNLISGTYLVTVTDANGCTATTSVVISQPAAPLSAIVSTSMDVLCFGNSTGSVDLGVVGGTAPYSYNWSNGSNTEDIGGLIAGTYLVTVTDANGCTATTLVAISQPAAPLSASILSSVNVGCFGNASGSADLGVTGGTTPYGYNWSNGSNTEDIGGLIAGTYLVTVTDANGCTATTLVSISQPVAPLSVSILSSVNVGCFGNASGSADLGVTGGTTPYSYVWSNGANTEDIGGLIAGTYLVTVTDANGCTATTLVSISQPVAPLSASILSSVNVGCFGNSTGSVDLGVVGGTAPYSYNWSNGSNTEDIGGLIAGTYLVTVTDANGCTATTLVAISQPAAPLSASILSSVNVGCFGNASGSADLGVTGGTTPYGYNWSNGANTEDIGGLIAGTYLVTVTDANGCTATTLVSISQPSIPLTLSLTQSPTKCDLDNGAANAIVIGGTPNYTYSWSSNNGVQNGSEISHLSFGSYSVTITDANGCLKIDSIVVGRIIPPEITVTSVTQETCSNQNGNITIEVIHGTPPYQIVWNSNPELHSYVLTNIGSGNYSVIATDANSCADTSFITIQNHPAQIVTIDSIRPAHCNIPDGCVQIVVEGGSGTYQYQWNTNPMRTNATECNLEPGAYIITVSDGMCDVLANAYVPNTKGPKADFTINKRSAPVYEATFIFTNQSHNYTSCIWDFGDNTTSTEINPSHHYSNYGIYHVILMVIDAFGCVDTTHADIIVTTELIVWIPNSFTPNSDGLNELFGPVATGYNEKGYEFRIFNRWGEEVFSSFDYNDRWDGTIKGVPLVTSYVFSWTLIICDIYGKQYKFKGNVTALGRNY